jgi:PAS domain S-box-containing protein
MCGHYAAEYEKFRQPSMTKERQAADSEANPAPGNAVDALRSRLGELERTSMQYINGFPNAAADRLILSALMDNLPDSIYFKDLQSRFIMINRALAKWFGLKHPSEAVGKTDFDFFSEEHARSAFQDERSVLETRQPIMGKEEKETWPDRPVTWVSTTKMPWYGFDGELIGTFGISRDVTKRKLAEEALMRSEEELRHHKEHLEELVTERTSELRSANEQLHREMRERALAEQRYTHLLGVSPTYIYTVRMKDGAPVSTEHSNGCLRVTGYLPEEYQQKSDLWIQMVHPEDREMVQRFVAKDLTTAKSPPIEHRIIRKDAAVRWVRNTIVHHYDEQGHLTHYDGLVEDITDRKRAEEFVRDSERMRAIGNLADGVAVNFRNVMNIITSSASSIADHVIPNTPAHKSSLHIIDAAKHAAGLIHRLMSVARACDVKASDTILQPVSLGRTIRDIIELIGHSFAEQNIRIVVREIDRMPYVKADPNQLLDTLMNFFVNASEAMPEGGSITVHAERHRIAKPSPRRNPNPNVKGGEFVVLSIRDTGTGIDPAILHRIFEPFFTTKVQNASLGLGLTVADNLVNGWGGWITAHSKPGGGSVFRIFMPGAEAPAPAEAAETPLVIAGQTVLIIDDDEATLKELAPAFETAGFRVLTARSAAEGVAAFEKHVDQIAVTVVDMVLPGSPWPFALERILHTDPQASVIVTSGFSRDHVRRSMPRGGWGFMQKPFEPKQLVDAVTEIIRRNISAARETAQAGALPGA